MEVQPTDSSRRTFARTWGRGILFGALALSLGVGVPKLSAQGPYRFNPEHRRPVEETMRDLHGIRDQFPPHSGGQRERYQNAEHHLREFAERLHEGGYFDKGKLDQAIGDIQSVIDHNPLPPDARDTLRRDDDHLRDLREHYDHDYHYRP